MKFRILLKSFDNDLIDFACNQLRSVLLKTESKVAGVVSLPIKIKKFCVLRSPHIDKDSREHFELRFYKRFIDLETSSPLVIELLLKTELPAGVSCGLKMLENKLN
uniref:Ribosomal protein S10 n=1 Tax=Mallomonas splendens TaxID=52552 RepID=A0A3G2QZZ6_9STRA|nr:ribosomal protein S10 [Mallomonas splendens]AYO28555.1 ribosomal protein S10 [Mallomonas splendens]